MRRHIRDVHEITSISTSPPAKKIRKSTVDNSDIEDLSLKLEDMDIENAEEEILLERSRKMDQKVKEKEEKLQKEQVMERI